LPKIAFADIFIILTPLYFETNGIDLDARRLHSITETVPSLTMNCVLNGPLI